MFCALHKRALTGMRIGSGMRRLFGIQIDPDKQAGLRTGYILVKSELLEDF